MEEAIKLFFNFLSFYYLDYSKSYWNVDRILKVKDEK